jgi:biotin carboxyl carrier protein
VKYFVKIGEHDHEVQLVERLGKLQVQVDGEAFDVSYEEVDADGQVIVLHDGMSFAMSVEGNGSEVGVTLAGHHYACDIEDERERAQHEVEAGSAVGGGVIKSLMPGVVVEVLVEPGQTVAAGDALLILEAMKMQNEITAPWSGTVARISVGAAQTVAKGAPLIEIKQAPAS